MRRDTIGHPACAFPAFCVYNCRHVRSLGEPAAACAIIHFPAISEATKEICRISEERRRFIRSQDRLDELDNGVDASPQPSDICFLQQPQPLSPLPPPRRRRRRRKADNSSDSPCRGIKMIRITVDGESLSHLSSGRKRRIMRTLRFASLCRASRRIGGIAMQEVDDPGNGVSQESLFPSVNPGHCYIT